MIRERFPDWPHPDPQHVTANAQYLSSTNRALALIGLGD
jgi:hypothetical protein